MFLQTGMPQPSAGGGLQDEMAGGGGWGTFEETGTFWEAVLRTDEANLENLEDSSGWVRLRGQFGLF